MRASRRICSFASRAEASAASLPAFGVGCTTIIRDIGASRESLNRELEAIFSGQRGGHLQDVLNLVVSKVLPTEVTPFEFAWGENPSLRVGSVGEARLQPLKDQAGKRTTLQGAAAMGAFQLASLDVASSKGSRWSDPDLRVGGRLRDAARVRLERLTLPQAACRATGQIAVKRL